MKFHDTLNDKIWDLNTEDLIPEVKEKLEEIAEAFIEFLEIPTDAVLDKVITGSSASYNYNKYSDLDLHIIIDYDKVHEDCPLVNGYLNSLKKQFNDNHDITIHGVPVELYAEQKDQGTVHNGLYSLQTGWIDKPQKIAPTDNDAAVEAKFNEIKELVDKCDDSEEATELLEKIYNMRKAGLAEAGEFCTENLAFKKLRNEGCMDKLRQIKKEQIDKQLSLESYNEDKEAPKTLDYFINKLENRYPIDFEQRELGLYIFNSKQTALSWDDEFKLIKAMRRGWKEDNDTQKYYAEKSLKSTIKEANKIAKNLRKQAKEQKNKNESIKEDSIEDIVNSLINKYGKEKLQKGLQTPYQKDYIWGLLHREKGLDLTAILDCLKSKLEESLKEDWSAEDIDKYNKERLTKVKQALEEQFKRLGFTDVDWDEAKQIYFFRYLDEPYYIVINTPGINGTGYDLYKADDYGVAKGRLLTYRDVWLMPEDVTPFVRAILSDIHKFILVNESMEEDYEEDDYEDIPEEMHKERYVTYFETQEGRQKYTIYHVYTDSTDDSYNELCDKRDNQLGMYDSYQALKDALKERAEKIAKQQGWTVKSIENLGEDDEYYRERNKWESIKEDIDMEVKLSDYLTQNGFQEEMAGDQLKLVKELDNKKIEVVFWNDNITVEYFENGTRIGARKLNISDDLKLQKAINVILIDPNTKKPFIESINEGQSIKKWAQSMLPEIFKLLRKNGIPSKDYCVLGHVEICPNANFLVRKSDVEKVLELLPMAKENEYWDTKGNAASIRIEYDGLREFEKTLKSVNEEYKAGDEITIDGKTGVIDSTFRFAEDDSLLGVWVKFGNDVKYYTLEELNDKSKNEEKEMNEDIKTEYAIINFLKKYGFATQEDLYNNIGAQVFVIDNAVKELLKQDKIKFEDGQGQDGINGWKLTEQIEEDLATLEKKVDKAEQDIQTIIQSYTNNESLFNKLDESFKKALNEDSFIDKRKFIFTVNDQHISGKDDCGYSFECDINGDIKDTIEDYLENETSTLLYGDEEDMELDASEILDFKYDEQTKQGEFNYNIWYREEYDEE